MNTLKIGQYRYARVLSRPRHCVQCQAEYLPSSLCQKRCNDCRVKKKPPTPHSERQFRGKQCPMCTFLFIPNSGIQSHCDHCRPKRDKSAAKESRKARRQRQISAIGIIQCWYCGNPFQPTSLNARIACEVCRGHTKGGANGQADTYRVQGMLVAEFAFYTIMQQRGISLQYTGGRGGAWFTLDRTHFKPDFRVNSTNIYYEVVGSRQRYHQAKDKYQQFRDLYPELQLIVVRPDGSIIT